MRIEHVAMYVCDLEKAREFFVRFLDGKSNAGYYNEKTGFRSYFISFEDGARLELMNRPEIGLRAKSPDCTGYAHIAFSVGSREAVDALSRRLCDAGYELLSGPRITGDGYYEACILGIEGNQIEITT